MSKKGRLTIVGTGITAISHVSAEALSHIRNADKVYHIVTDPLTREWLAELNPSAEDLFPLYEKAQDRLTTYFLMTDKIVSAVRDGANVCAVFYGHPGVFVFPSHEALLRLRQEGFEAELLPAISAEDCLFADLGIDPGRGGCQSFEATDYLVHNRKSDPTSGLVLWQVGSLGEIKNKTCPPARLQILVDRLLRFYPEDHTVIIYEAKQYVLINSRIDGCRLRDLPNAKLTGISTLYVPPAHLPEIDFEMIRKLDIPEDFVTAFSDRRSLYSPLRPTLGSARSSLM